MGDDVLGGAGLHGDQQQGDLTLVDVARFCASDSALDFAATCKEWGLDPAADIEDDFLAWQMRYGLAVRLWEERGKPPPEPGKDPGDEVRDKVAQAKRDADAFEREMRGAL